MAKEESRKRAKKVTAIKDDLMKLMCRKVPKT